jgi:hypothetical protein
MRSTLKKLAAAVALMIAPGMALADAGTRGLHRDPSLTKADSVLNVCYVRPGRTCYYAFSQTGATDAHAANSAAFFVPATGADICIDTNTAGTDSAADGLYVEIYRVVSAATTNGSFLPNADESKLNYELRDCFHAIAGDYWFKVYGTGAGGTKVAIVSVTGSND